MVKPINIYPTNKDQLLKKAIPAQFFITQKSDLSEVIPNSKDWFWDDAVISLIEDLKDTAEASKDSIGLAANQIWDKPEAPPAVFVVKFKRQDGTEYWQEFINPEIVTSGRKIKTNERCMSVRSNYACVREDNATISFQTLESNEFKKWKFFGRQSYIPIILQHEFDHLKGKLINGAI